MELFFQSGEACNSIQLSIEYFATSFIQFYHVGAMNGVKVQEMRWS